MAVSVAFVVAAATAAVVTSTATSSLSAKIVYEVLYLLVACSTLLKHPALEVECLAGKRMVEVHLHLIIGNGENTTIEMVAVLILQRNDCTLKDVLVVEVAINLEDAAVEVQHTRLFIIAVCLVLGQFKVEGRAWFKILYLILKLVEGYSESRYELERLSGWCLFNFFSHFAVNGVERVAHSHEHVVIVFHFLLCINLFCLFRFYLAKVLILFVIAKCLLYFFPSLHIYSHFVPFNF